MSPFAAQPFIACFVLYHPPILLACVLLGSCIPIIVITSTSPCTHVTARVVTFSCTTFSAFEVAASALHFVYCLCSLALGFLHIHVLCCTYFCWVELCVHVFCFGSVGLPCEAFCYHAPSHFFLTGSGGHTDILDDSLILYRYIYIIWTERETRIHLVAF